MTVNSSRRLHPLVALGLMLLLAPGLTLAADPEHDRDEIVVCSDLVPDWLMMANATFFSVFRLDLDKSGRVTRVATIRNDLLPLGPVTSCLRRWRLAGPGRRANVGLQWTHGVGWTFWSISMNGKPYRTLRFTGPPYEPGARP